MLRKLFGWTALGVLILGGTWAGSARTEDAADKAAPFVHTVIFHLKPDAPAGEAEALITDAHELLAKIPSVRELRVGRPADKFSEGARKDYQVGLLVLFDDYQGLQTYAKHPLHLKYVEKHLKHVDVDRLRIYDFENQKK
jgi:Stress responsive A/B Barrel Domain